MHMQQQLTSTDKSVMAVINLDTVSKNSARIVSNGATITDNDGRFLANKSL